ncbi:hypothetical protein [Flavobacterium gilvum]|uniref:Uncharacterized protein n=1 Tax=Flavobacterium gilvum TaxID=1492737 RepID=A0AAC9I5G7_9FLAO|nr:hypothetical protein [Flavobacterium gilvum]AOW10035.1 hypothetical protein EM308_11225 [Flavobacterium gilvum]KFC60440.1 hypothetical protein FEM08_08170 [Flavobacterium gilvum]
MLTYNEHIELREKLANDEITLAAAKELLWKDKTEGQRSWHTKDWKDRRVDFLKDKCELCDSTDTLTIQHLSHPKKFNEYKSEVTKKYVQIYKESDDSIDKIEFMKFINSDYDYYPILLCPNCEGRNPSHRVRKKPQYRCTECKHEFDKPNYKTETELVETFYKNDEAIEVRDKCFVSKKWQNQFHLSSLKYWFQREKTTNKDIDSIEKEAMLLYLDDNIKYLSFEDTITACKKCASYADLYNLELCPKCKTHYKGIQYPTCIQCLPDVRRKSALEAIEFGKQWAEMHRNLGME